MPMSGAGRGTQPRTVAAAVRALGYRSLREGQREGIEALLAGRDVLAVMPTGSGKSAIYEIAGALLDGPTVVVSPLVALQRDQAQGIAERGNLGAAELHAALGDEDREERLSALERGELEYLLLAPEQLARPETLARVRRASPSLLVVDEAHCISEWGHDFRPAYVQLGAMAAELGPPRMLALTATAAPAVRNEIVERLAMDDPLVIVRGFDRPNIHLSVEAAASGAAREDAVVAAVCAEPSPGLVYCSTRAACERLAGALRDRGVRALPYHAGQARSRREAAQDAFMEGAADVVVATVAFGMGVDKPDVRFVVHAQPSSSVDAYWQEVGRAGRDGLPARAVLFCGPRDLGSVAFQRSAPAFGVADVRSVLELLAAVGEPVEERALRRAIAARGPELTAMLARLTDLGAITTTTAGEIRLVPVPGSAATVARAAVERQEARRAYQRSRLEMMRGYVETTGCRRSFVLNYFGEDFTPPCGACDACDAGATEPFAGEVPFRLGDRVEHAALGRGAVHRVESDRIVVLFERGGYTTLDAGLVLEERLLRPASGGDGDGGGDGGS
jgi:ATP-dependent DNA helicase RecQ